MMTWGLFLVAIGMFLIMYSPMTESPLIMAIAGIIWAIVGFVLYRKGKKK